MKVGPAGMHLRLVCIEQETQSETALTEAHTRARIRKEIELEDPQEVPVHGVHSEQWWHDDRIDRIRMLRARVKSGTYRVDSMALAECILEDEVRPLLS